MNKQRKTRHIALKQAAKKSRQSVLSEDEFLASCELGARKDCVNGVIQLDPNNPSDRELWFDDDIGRRV